MVSLEDKIAPDNAVRFIDAFVSVIDLKIFSFCQFNPKEAIGKWLYFKSFFIRFLLFLVFGGVVQRLPMLAVVLILSNLA